MGIIIAFIVLVILIFKKVPILVAAPICALLIAVLSGLPPLTSLTNEYMAAMAQFIRSNFLLFLLSSIFGKLMDASGAAYAVGSYLSQKLGARYAIIAISLSSLILCYGGVSVFVIVFAMYPIALVLFKEANLSRTLIPAAIGAGAFLAPCASMPGSPQIVNVIPTQYLGTTVMAAPVVGVVCSVFMFVAATGYVIWSCARLQKQGHGFVATAEIDIYLEEVSHKNRVNPFLSILPMLVIIVTLNVLKINILIAILMGILLTFILFWKNITDKGAVLLDGANDSISAIMNTAAAVGVGGVAQVTSAFATLVSWVGTFQGPPLISLGLATTLVAGATGSGSGGLGIALQTLGAKYIEMGLSPEIIHRVASCAAIGLDSLPWNGCMITTLMVCGLTHKEGYKHLFIISVVITLINLVLAIGLGTILYPIGG